jgi:hypothetical protein
MLIAAPVAASNIAVEERRLPVAGLIVTRLLVLFRKGPLILDPYNTPELLKSIPVNPPGVMASPTNVPAAFV